MKMKFAKSLSLKGFFCGAALLAFVSATSSNAKGIPTPPPPAPSAALFPASNCSVPESLEKARPYFESQYSFIRVQGIMPWPDLDGRFDINGIWTNANRATYAVVRQVEHTDSPSYGALSVKFYSACSHMLLAEGTRILSRRDWDNPEISVSLRNYRLKGSRLRAYIRAVVTNDRLEQEEALEVEIREARYGTRDHFSMGRFE